MMICIDFSWQHMIAFSFGMVTGLICLYLGNKIVDKLANKAAYKMCTGDSYSKWICHRCHLPVSRNCNCD
jgi:hypothetical protein